MSQAVLSEFSALLNGAYAGSGTAVAAGTGDNTEVTGTTIDLDGFRSGALLITYTTALDEDETLSFGVKVQESSNGTDWDTAEVIQALTAKATGGTGGSTVTGCEKYAVNFEGRKRYLRFNITPDLSRGATDTARWAGTLVRGGAENLPVS